MKHLQELLLLTFLSFFSQAFCAVEGYIYVEGEVEKVERAWSSNPLTGLPIRVTPAIWMKVSTIKALKKIPLENDTWESEFGGTVIGKGFRLEPVPMQELNNPHLREVMEQIQSKTEAQRISYFGGEESAKFMLRAGKIWNQWKGPIEFRGVVDVQTWTSDGAEKISFHITPAQIKHGSKVLRKRNYREFWTNPRPVEENFQRLYQLD